MMMTAICHDQEQEQWRAMESKNNGCNSASLTPSLSPQFITPQNETDFDWAARQLPHDGIKEAPDWISSQRRLSNDPSQLQSPWHRQLPTVHPTC